jgi:magnesium-transporting ATPase (P-type)
MTPEQKGHVVRIVKEKLLYDPCICAVGEGNADTLMMQEADISIEIVHKI